MHFDKCIEPRVLRKPSSQSPALRGITEIEKVKEAGSPSEIPRKPLRRQKYNQTNSCGYLKGDTMGLNDGFLDMVACPYCGEKVLMRLQIKIDGVYMNDYSPGDSVASEVIASVRRNEAGFVAAVGKDLDIPPGDLTEIPLESANDSFAVVGSAYLVGKTCECGQAPEYVPCVATVSRGIFKGLSPELPQDGPIVTSHGMVFSRWMLHSERLRSVLSDILGDPFDVES